MPTQEIIDRLHVPTEEEIDDCKRLFMTCENARKTLLEQKTQTRRIISDVSDTWDRVDRIENRNDRIAWQAKGDHGLVEVLGVPKEYEVGETRLLTTPHWRAHSGTKKDRVWDSATGVVRFSDSTPNGPNEICIPERESWHPSENTEYDWHQIHASFLMPTWASRIAVEVTDVWIERLHEIDYQGMMAEGVKPETTPGVEAARSGRMMAGTPSSFIPKKGLQGRFIELWNSINGEGAWERNDFVRCIEYELIT